MNFGVGFNEGGKKVEWGSDSVIDASLPASGSVQGLRECSISLTFITSRSCLKNLILVVVSHKEHKDHKIL